MQTEKLTINKEIIAYHFFVEKRNTFSITWIQKKIVNNKHFWQTVKPFFSDKNRVKNKIALIEDKTKTASDNNLVAETFNNFFINIVPSLVLQCDDMLVGVEHIPGPLEKTFRNSKSTQVSLQ